MRTLRVLSLLFATVALLAAEGGASGGTINKEIDRFNQRLIDLHLKMDDAGILALWEEDGVDLMPDMAPLVGKSAITTWLQGVLANLKGYKVVTQEMEFHDIRVAGDWASEWANSHQVVQPPAGKPIEIYGKIAFILHRAPNGEWKIAQEMWNSSPRPVGQAQP